MSLSKFVSLIRSSLPLLMISSQTFEYILMLFSTLELLQDVVQNRSEKIKSVNKFFIMIGFWFVNMYAFID
ncbi:hypothetical protein GCM10023314_31030 [Algibacter agarivorans]|uniref:Uncharacterized protein n=1 Tax=Algibacter agarivorans TaxID=1109741 RepID=A0ABP9H028_9FLAO